LSEREARRLLTAIRAEAKRRGTSWETEFARHLFSDDWREAAAFFKMLTDRLFTKATALDVTVQRFTEPAIYLPEQRPDPAKLIPLPTRPVGA
jgi:hypothetical protein